MTLLEPWVWLKGTNCQGQRQENGTRGALTRELNYQSHIFPHFSQEDLI